MTLLALWCCWSSISNTCAPQHTELTSPHMCAHRTCLNGGIGNLQHVLAVQLTEQHLRTQRSESLQEGRCGVGGTEREAQMSACDSVK
jgi:hypothetical protein